MAFEFWRYASPGWGLRQDIERRRRRLNVLLPGEPGVEEIEPETAPQGGVSPFLAGLREQFRPGPSPFRPEENAPYKAIRRAFWNPEVSPGEQYGETPLGAIEPFLASPVGRLLSPKPTTADWWWALPPELQPVGEAIQAGATAVRGARAIVPGAVSKFARAPVRAAEEMGPFEVELGIKAGKGPKGKVPIPSEAIPPVAPGVAKEPWQMTRAEFEGGLLERYNEMAKRLNLPSKTILDESSMHRWAVENAHFEGKLVPPEVLAEYGLEAKAIPKAEAGMARAGEFTPEVQAVINKWRGKPLIESEARREIIRAGGYRLGISETDNAIRAIKSAEPVAPAVPRAAEAVAPEVITPKAFSIDDVIAWKRKNVAEASGVMERSFRNQELKDLLAGKKAGRQTVSEEYFRNPRTKELEIPVELQPKPQIPEAAIPKAEAIPITTKESEVGARFAAFLDKTKEKWAMEEAGQAILDDLSFRGKSPTAVSEEFWTSTYPKLPPVVQRRFERYLNKLTSFKPGDTIGQDAKGNPIKVNTWQGVAAEADLPGGPQGAESLEDIGRGYVALMEEANKRFAEARAGLPPAIPKAEAVAPGVTRETTALIQQLREAFVGTDRLDEAIAILPDGMALTGREFKGVGAFQHLAEGLPPVEQWLDAGVVRTGLEANGTFFVEIRGGLSSEQFSTLSKLMRDAPNVIVDFGYFQNEIVKSLQGTPNIVRRQLRELIAIPKAEALPPEVARVMPSELGPAVEVAPKAGALPPARPPIELPPPVEAAPAKAKIPPSVPSAPVITPGGKLWLPEPPRTTPAYMAATRKAMGGVFRGKKGAFDTIEEAHQMVLKARDMGEQTVPYVQSYIAQIGDVVKSFGVDKQGMATLVGNPGGRSLAINDVLSNFTHYTLTPEQLELAKRSGLVYQEALKLARSYGVKISELGGPDEFWQYIARRVKSKLNPLTGEYEMPPSVIGGFKMGAKISAQKERVFEEMAQGVDLGFLYENPAQVMTQHIRGIYRLIGNKQAQNLIKPLTRQITAKAPLKFGERAIAEPALKSRAAAVELANAIDKIFLAQQAPRALRGAADISGAMVGQVAALDISAPFIQGLPVIGHDLKMGLRGKPSGVWLKSYGNMWKAVWNPESINNFRMRNAELYKRAIEAGILTGQSEFVSGVGTVQKGLGKIPKVGPPLKEVYRQVYGRMGQAYSDFLEIARLKLFEQLEPVWAREGHNTFELGAVINRMTGTVSSAARGVGPMQRTAERTAAFAPNYLRASLLLLRDLISRGASAREVQTSLAALLGIGAAVYYAEEKLRGQEPLMKPWPRRLGGNGAAAFTFGIGDTRVGLGSWMYGMIKTLTEVGAMAVDEPGVLVVWNERHPIVKFAKSKRGPMVGLIQELATGRDFFGQKLEGPTDYLLRLVETVVPISAQPMISQKPKGELVQVGAELMGLRAHPYSLKSRWADEGAFKAYEDIPAQSRSAFRKGHPDIDAKLFITGQVDSILSEQASRQVIQLILENKIDPETISGVQRNKEEREKWAEAKLRDPSKITPTDRLVRYLESPAFKAQQKLKQAPAPSQPEMPQELQDFIKQNTALEEVLKRAWQAYQEGNFKVAEGLWDSYDLSAYQQKKKELRERLREGAGVAIR